MCSVVKEFPLLRVVNFLKNKTMNTERNTFTLDEAALLIIINVHRIIIINDYVIIV